MTAPTPTAPPDGLVWAAYTTAERQAQADYNAAVDEAQRNFALDAKPAIDTYHAVEGAAWQRYAMAHRAATRRYLEAIQAHSGQAAPYPMTPITASVPPQDGPDAIEWPARPSFTPHPETEE